MIEHATECPECGSSWVGPITPPKQRHLYAGTGPHFSRLIGVETEGYDGVSFWECPDCRTQWSRWTGKLVTKGNKQ